jgi:hypothetical protein
MIDVFARTVVGLLGWAALVVCLEAAAVEKGKETKVSLGGPREVEAVIRATASEYVVRVTMRPVEVFGPETNARLNERKARLLALQALARHLSDEPTVTLSVRGATVEEARPDGKRYTLTLTVPRKGVTVVRGEEPAPDKEKRERVAFSSAYLRAREDHENTLQHLTEAFQKELADVAAVDTTEPGKEDPEVVSTMEGIGAEGQKLLDRLAEHIRSDRLLSDVAMFGKPSEREALLQKVAQAKKSLTTQVARSLAEHERKKAPPREKK